MTWIVLGEEKNQMIKLVSSRKSEGILPKGSYLTIYDNTGDGGTERSLKILRVEGSSTEYPYSPSAYIADVDIPGIEADVKWQNIILARIVRDLDTRDDGLINPVLPRQLARRTNQSEIEFAMGMDEENFSGPKVFLATVQESRNQILIDENKEYMTAKLNQDFFFHQTLVVGKTGSGKTVAMKYLAQYFVEKLDGAVLAVNVKDVDFLKMDQASNIITDKIQREWNTIEEEPHGVSNFMIYHPPNALIDESTGVNLENTKPASLDVNEIEPEALTGLLRNITDIAAESLPKIFECWRDNERKSHHNNLDDIKFTSFVKYVEDIHSKKEGKDQFPVNITGTETYTTLASGTVSNILRNLVNASEFFDKGKDTVIRETDILQKGKMSVINISGDNGKVFGSIILRHLLHRIVERKSIGKSNIPVLIIIDEVHEFYNTASSREALGDLDTICREGRSKKIGVMFASQNPGDIPSGLSSVINTKLIFKSDYSAVKSHGITISDYELQSLQKGYACVNIHEMSQLRLVKFPLSLGGVIK